MAGNNIVIAVDFDGTCVTHEYPHTGLDVGAVPVLRELTDAGCRLILLTMRSGELLERATEWFRKNDIPLWAVNENPEQKSWTRSTKVYADIYIDDSAIGCPIKFRDGVRKPFVDWQEVRRLLVHDGVLND